MRRCPTCHSQYTESARVCPIDGTALADVPDPLVGRTIGGRYLVAELVGTGGMGSVYRGRHQLVGRDVALKFLAPRYARDPAARERFLREARAANRIDHEHIIDITDFGETSDNLVFLVMEFLDGELLSKIIENGPLPPARALNIALQLSQALARAHELDVIHRDIKPDNVFVLQRRGGDFVKLLDFGLAKVIGEHRLTATGKVFGTPEYLAPEQARGENPSGHTDQYALGCMLYEMLTGQLPFEGTTPDVILRHLQVAPDKPSQRKPDLPLAEELDTLVLRMLEKLPRDRFVDAHHVADELRRLLELLSGGRPSRPTPRSLSAPSLDPAMSATQPWVDAAEENWAQRSAQFTSLLPQAYPNGGAPLSIRNSVAEMSELVARSRSVRLGMGANLLRAKEREDALRLGRLQVGRAIDELGRDESRVSRRIQELGTAIEGLRKQLSEVGQELSAALAARMVVGGKVTRRMAEDVRRIGGRASHWLDIEGQVEPLEARLVSSEREREDLHFQIAQLKGRMGILNAEADADLGALREEADRLGAELQRLLEQLSNTGTHILQTLGALPGMREKLGQARASLDGQIATK